jgi:hypothetical protein
MIVKLICTRYNDLKEYRQKILTRHNLPSYVDSLLDSECFSSTSLNGSNNQTNKNLFMALINDQQFQRKLADIKELGMNNHDSTKTQTSSIATSTPAIHSNSLLNTFLQQNNNKMNSNQNKMPDNKTSKYFLVRKNFFLNQKNLLISNLIKSDVYEHDSAKPVKLRFRS